MASFSRIRRSWPAGLLLAGLLIWAPSSASDGEALRSVERGLKKTCAGKSLLRELDKDPEVRRIKVRLLARELERAVEVRTGRLVSRSDEELLESIRSLKRLPRRSGCNPEAAVMGMIDEWSARATDAAKRERSERFVEKLRTKKRPKTYSEKEWLRSWFPVLYADAKRILAYLG